MVQGSRKIFGVLNREHERPTSNIFPKGRELLFLLRQPRTDINSVRVWIGIIPTELIAIRKPVILAIKTPTFLDRPTEIFL